jgi:hypothetical protein
MVGVAALPGTHVRSRNPAWTPEHQFVPITTIGTGHDVRHLLKSFVEEEPAGELMISLQLPLTDRTHHRAEILSTA